jgi:signal peptidase I
VDAIVYALILVYFIFAFIGQNYQIPSSSLEKSLLVGDYLWVNKMIYGPRVPQTPLHFPLAQHTLPIVNCKSYIEQPQLKYHRLKGIRKIERGDIVVFNYPQGDTVPSLIDPKYGDYYAISNALKMQGISNPREYMEQNPQMFGKLIWRPVDRRENYVKRAIGLPGERLKIVNDDIYINGEKIAAPENVQFNYIIPVKGSIPMEQWEEIGVRSEDVSGGPISDYNGLFYSVPLTAEMKKTVENWQQVSGPLTLERESGLYDLGGVFPLGNNYGWTRPNMGEIWIPQKGKTLRLTLQNLPIYQRAIATYEGNDLEVRDGKIYINGKETDTYTFQMDYYWMMGDNRDRSADSRYWGFVPEDHIVGSPMFVIVSFDEDRTWLDGKIRWNRIFKNANPDKAENKW